MRGTLQGALGVKAQREVGRGVGEHDCRAAKELLRQGDDAKLCLDGVDRSFP